MPVQNVKQKDKVSPVNAAIAGAVSGYALKYALPFSNFEKKLVKNEQADAVVQNAARNARKKEYKAIVDKLPELNISKEATDVFISNRNQILDNEFETSGIDKKVMETLSGLLKRVSDKGNADEQLTKEMFKAYGKQSRSTFYFVAFGAIVLLSIAALYNSLSNTKNQK